MNYLNEDSAEVSASKAGDLAYNKVIVDNVKREMYKQYNIELWNTVCNGSMSSSQSKSSDELNKELVNAIAIEKAKSKLRGLK